MTFPASYPMEGWEIKIEIARAIKYHLFEGHKRKPCYWCSNPLEFDSATIEHLKPQSLGGTWDLENCAIACFSCNQKRGTREIEEFKSSSWLQEKRKQVLAVRNNRNIPVHPDGMEMSEEEIRLAAELYLRGLTREHHLAIIAGLAKQSHLDRWAREFVELNHD